MQSMLNVYKWTVIIQSHKSQGQVEEASSLTLKHKASAIEGI